MVTQPVQPFTILSLPPKEKDEDLDIVLEGLLEVDPNPVINVFDYIPNLSLSEYKNTLQTLLRTCLELEKTSNYKSYAERDRIINIVEAVTAFLMETLDKELVLETVEQDFYLPLAYQTIDLNTLRSFTHILTYYSSWSRSIPKSVIAEPTRVLLQRLTVTIEPYENKMRHTSEITDMYHRILTNIPTELKRAYIKSDTNVLYPPGDDDQIFEELWSFLTPKQHILANLMNQQRNRYKSAPTISKILVYCLTNGETSKAEGWFNDLDHPYIKASQTLNVVGVSYIMNRNQNSEEIIPASEFFSHFPLLALIPAVDLTARRASLYIETSKEIFTRTDDSYSIITTYAKKLVKGSHKENSDYGYIHKYLSENYPALKRFTEVYSNVVRTVTDDYPTSWLKTLIENEYDTYIPHVTRVEPTNE